MPSADSVLTLLATYGYVVVFVGVLLVAARVWRRHLGSAWQGTARRLDGPVLRWAIEHRGALGLLLGCVLAPLAIVGEIATEVFVHGGLPWDVGLLEAVHRRATPAADSVVLAVTHAGGAAVLSPASVMITGLLALARRRADAAFLALAMGGSALVNLLAKAVLQRDRPAVFTPLDPQRSYSFPSGHAMASMAFAAAVTTIAWNTRWRWPVLVAGGAFTLAVGSSRVYVGVHYPTDILAGWLASVAWVVGLHLVMRRAPRTTDGAVSAAPAALVPPAPPTLPGPGVSAGAMRRIRP